ncbi:MAG: Fe-S cluster assembly protein SufD, partial [Gammaproteobacteria bacterium]|nr:Fe-S cluster assembly protein SufD [Gammaproteobacteria bacterium]
MSAAAALPTTRDENWRYAPLRGVERLSWDPPAALTTDAIEAARPLLGPSGAAARWTFVDG